LLSRTFRGVKLLSPRFFPSGMTYHSVWRMPTSIRAKHEELASMAQEIMANIHPSTALVSGVGPKFVFGQKAGQIPFEVLPYIIASVSTSELRGMQTSLARFYLTCAALFDGMIPENYEDKGVKFGIVLSVVNVKYLKEETLVDVEQLTKTPYSLIVVDNQYYIVLNSSNPKMTMGDLGVPEGLLHLINEFERLPIKDIQAVLEVQFKGATRPSALPMVPFPENKPDSYAKVSIGRKMREELTNYDNPGKNR
jgi:hypothetical protein